MLSREEELLKEFDVILEQEEMVWFQKSREKWVNFGDRNTKFFHTSTVIRRRRNHIETLRNDEDKWVSDIEELESMAVQYFTRLYSLENVDPVVEKLPHEGFPSLSRDDKVELSRPFSGMDIELAVRSMGSFKAPRPDGYQPIFYQRSWEVVGESVIQFALEFFESGQLPQETNDALIVLIPKVASPEKITQFRPISLCNVLFKIITKAMVRRLEQVMVKLIGPAQSSFIPGRLINDNIVVVQEAIHSMRYKQGKKDG